MNFSEFRISIINGILQHFNVNSKTRRVVGDNVDVSQENVSKGQITNSLAVVSASIDSEMQLYVSRAVDVLAKQMEIIQRRIPRRSGSPALLVFMVDQLSVSERQHVMPGFTKFNLVIPFYTTANVDRIMKFKI